MAEMDDSKRPTPLLRWYYWTRFLGSLLIVFGLLVDHTEQRSTIILTGAGLLGIDKVARNEGAKEQ